MAASSIQNPAAAEPKIAKKKKAKVARTESPAPSASAVASDKATSVAPQDAVDESEPAYLRELSKNIRNVNKKLTNASKTDSLIAEHKDKSLEELVSLKIINPDQKAQVLKKPALSAQLAQLEEQYSQFKKLDADYRQRIVSDKADVTKTLTEKLEKEKTEAVAAATAAAKAEAEQKLYDSLLAVSQFLRLAATRRADDQNAQLDENLALEGILLQVYAGDDTGVSTMVKLVNGADEAAKSVTNETLQTTFAQVKAAAAAAAPSNAVEEVVEEAPEAAKVESDPTLTHASLTEIEAGDDKPLVNGSTEPEAEAAHANGIHNTEVADDAANAAGESQWDTNNASKDLALSQEWVEVPRDPAETETGLTATPAAPANTQSWADEQPDTPPPVPATTASAAPAAAAAVPEANDGFHQVQRHNRARSERDNWRGGRGGGFRGRGGRGGAGGEGRGGQRGGEGRPHGHGGHGGHGGRGGRGRGGNGNGANGGNPNANGNGGHRGPRRNEEQ